MKKNSIPLHSFFHVLPVLYFVRSVNLLSALLLVFNDIAFPGFSRAQGLGINETGEAPHPSAILDVSSLNKGFLLPRIALTSTLDNLTVSNCCATGLLVFNESTSGTPPHQVEPGFYYWNGTQWVPLHSAQVAGWLLQGNTGTNPATQYLGTQDNVPLNIKVNSSQTLRFNTNFSIQRDDGGNSRGIYALDFQYLRDSSEKVAAGYASFIGSGENNWVSGDHAGIVSGLNNKNFAEWGFIGGGSQNMLNGATGGALISGYSNTNSGIQSILGSGRFNNLSGNYSVLMGGESNNVGGAYNTVGGGVGHVCASGYNFIGGGQANEALGNWNVIGGGSYNISQNWYSFVGGGNYNKATGDGSVAVGGYENKASGTLSVVVGGWDNKALGERGAVFAGEMNTSQGDYAAVITGLMNSVNGAFSVLGSGVQNVINGTYNSMLGGTSNLIQNNYNFIGGGQSNVVTGEWSVVAGGSGNNVSGMAASVIGGAGNQAPGTFTCIGGGKNNYAGGPYSFIGSGLANSIASDYAVIGGGNNNYVNTSYAFLGGGLSNIVSGDYGVVAGGRDNKASDYVAAVCGGMMNEAQGNSSFVGGGRANQAAGMASVIVGGSENVAQQAGAIVLGGDQNNVNGEYSVILGGYNNAVTGNYVLLYGRNVDPTVNESFRFYLFGDGSNPWYPNPSGFLVINRPDGDHPIHVGTNGTNGNGAFLSAGGTWTNASTRSKKDRFIHIDAEEVLDKVLQMPVEGWYYKGTEEFHIGPYAEDFYALFHTGNKSWQEAPHYLASSDVAGVSLLALKGLNFRLNQKLQQLEHQYAQLLSRLELLENLYAEKCKMMDSILYPYIVKSGNGN